LVSVDGLDSWGLKDRLLSYRRVGRTETEIRRVETARGTLPPGRTGGVALDSAREAVDPIVDELERIGAQPTATSTVRIDVELSSGHRLVGTVDVEQSTPPGPVTASVSKHKPKHELRPWLELVALTADDPTVRWRSVLVSPPQRSGQDAVTTTFEIPLDSPAERRRRAVDALESVIALYLRGRCEPLPIFPGVSPALVGDGDPVKAWSDTWGGKPDGENKWVLLAFDYPSLDDVLSIPARPDDPVLQDHPLGNSPHRVERLAACLWGAIERSQQPVDEAGAD
ncbi:MAG: hypothetical protein ACR2O6_13690, partial [Ilumatobacteraceae bacterium]